MRWNSKVAEANISLDASWWRAAARLFRAHCRRDLNEFLYVLHLRFRQMFQNTLHMRLQLLLGHFYLLDSRYLYRMLHVKVLQDLFHPVNVLRFELWDVLV